MIHITSKSENHTFAPKQSYVNVLDEVVDVSGQGIAILRRHVQDRDLPLTTRTLIAADNVITQLDPSLAELTELEEITLDCNRFDHIPWQCLMSFKKLSVLSICNQRGSGRQAAYQLLRRIPDEISNCRGIRELYASKNNICDVAVGLAMLPNLEVLDLTDNGLRTLPSELFEYMTELRYLGLSGNHLMTIPSTIGCMKKLQVLRLSNNKLREIPESVCQLTELVTLSLAHNQLISLPFELFKLRQLVATSKPAYHLKHINRTFRPTLTLKDNNAMIYPHPDTWMNGRGECDVNKLFENMAAVYQDKKRVHYETEKIKRSSGVSTTNR